MTVQDRSGRAGFAAFMFAGSHIEFVVEALQRAVPSPQVHIAVDRAAGRKVLRQRSPLTAIFQLSHIEQAIDHRPQIHLALSPAPLRRRNQRGDDLPFGIGQITGIAQSLAIITRTSLSISHLQPPVQRLLPAQPFQSIQHVFGQALSLFLSLVGPSHRPSLIVANVTIRTIKAYLPRFQSVQQLI